MNNGVTVKLVLKAIKEQGRKKGWVADRIGVKRNRFSEYLSGRTELTTSELYMLGHLLNLNAEKAA